MIIAFANQKGGVAKTTTCVNLGAGLALRGHSTLLIDTDPQASLSRYLGAHGTNDAPSLGDWMMGRASFDDVKSSTPYNLLDIVPTREALTADELAMKQNEVKTIHYLRLKLQEVHGRYQFILIDMMPGFTTLFVNSLIAADQVLIPVKLEWLSMQGLTPLLEKILDVQDSGKKLDILGIVGTFFQVGVNERVKCLEEIERLMPGKIFSTVIRQNIKVAEASASHMPIQHYDRASQGFKDYEALVDEVLVRAGVKYPTATGARQ